MVKKLKYDFLVKIIMTDPLAAKAFLEYYSDDFKNLVDLSRIVNRERKLHRGIFK
ncbi:prenyltransferase [Rickettsia canadensis str. McKiel]|uniref:Prenyltransferase n=1 Tax=Rickettsia canadensis (strain McKiel) TaxID=293613 RepID=A8EZQ4_RICCK|nr:prenyltransferase [Rickettsia canadensis]ABV73837.1 prenyltransferase [Rickettsia canadensis str. McKiel]